MENKAYRKSFLPLLYIFILSSFLILIGLKVLRDWGFSIPVMLSGNLILFFATLGSFVFYQRSLQNNNTQFFLRMMYSGLLLKMFVCVLAVLAYALVVRSEINKPSLFICFGFYFIYTFVEVKILMRLTRQQKNA
jgi:hypothetical protein